MLAIGMAGSVLAQGSPRYRAPGHDLHLSALETLFRRHDPGTLPKSTLWDAWLVAPSLWPDGEDAGARRASWRAALLSREIDDDGYVATHQHPSIAHPRGWPFPFWGQGRGVGWHFSFHDTVGTGWRPDATSDLAGFELQGARVARLEDRGFQLEITAPGAAIVTPPFELDVLDAPFVQVRVDVSGAGPIAPVVEWLLEGERDFDASRSVPFAIEPGAMRHVAVAMYRDPRWNGRIARLRLSLGNREASGSIVLQALFSQYDTRHNVNNSAFVIGSADYFAWTGDVDFLRANAARMRRAIEHLQVEHHLIERKVVRTTWVGHDGRSGIAFDATGGKRVLPGRGVGSNYWDLLPFGWDDAYATNYAYAALLRMAEIEDAIAMHGEWKIAAPSSARDATALRSLASEVRMESNRRFFIDGESGTGRFAACVDADGVAHDYGFTFVNLEAIAFGLASDEHARSVFAWLDGERIVPGDTSTGADVYSFRFGPRATTRRNVDWYGWFWSGPESIPFGGQVQDGGAVLGFSYFDVMARLRVNGPDDAWKRMKAILDWSDEVEKAGGYRSYYAAHPVSTLQGCGTAGGLGLDCEFFESAMVAQAWVDGFLGFRPLADGSFVLDPRLPTGFDSIGVNGIRVQDRVLSVEAAGDSIVIRQTGGDGRGAQRVRFRGATTHGELATGGELQLRGG